MYVNLDTVVVWRVASISSTLAIPSTVSLNATTSDGILTGIYPASAFSYSKSLAYVLFGGYVVLEVYPPPFSPKSQKLTGLSWTPVSLWQNGRVSD